MVGGLFGGCGRNCSFIMKTVQIASSFLEILYPFLGLNPCARISPDVFRQPGCSMEAYIGHTSAIIMWQSKVPLPCRDRGRSTCERIFFTTGAPNVMLGTKWPSMISMCSQSATCPMVSEHAAPRAAKSADRIDGAIIAAGDMIQDGRVMK